jgi:hypothetical protein
MRRIVSLITVLSLVLSSVSFAGKTDAEINEMRYREVTSEAIEEPYDDQVFKKVQDIEIDWPKISDISTYRVSIRDMTDDRLVLDNAHTKETDYKVDRDLFTAGHRYKIAVTTEFEDPFYETHFDYVYISFKEGQTDAEKNKMRRKEVVSKLISDPYANQVFKKVQDIEIDWPSISDISTYRVSIRDMTEDELVLDNRHTRKSHYVANFDLFTAGHKYKIAVTTEFEDPFYETHFDDVYFSFEEIAKDELENIQLSVNDSTVYEGDTVRFKAIGHYSISGDQDITDHVDYGFSEENVFIEEDGNTFEAYDVGETEVWCTYSGIESNRIDLSCREIAKDELENIQLSVNDSTVYEGDTVRFKAIGHYSISGDQDITDHVDYGFSEENVFIEEDGNTFEAYDVGETEVWCTYSGIESNRIDLSCREIAKDELENIQLSVNDSTVYEGDTVRFKAIGHYSISGDRDITAYVNSKFTTRNIFIEANDNRFKATKVGNTLLQCTYLGIKSNEVQLTCSEKEEVEHSDFIKGRYDVYAQESKFSHRIGYVENEEIEILGKIHGWLYIEYSTNGGKSKKRGYIYCNQFNMNKIDPLLYDYKVGRLNGTIVSQYGPSDNYVKNDTLQKYDVVDILSAEGAYYYVQYYTPYARRGYIKREKINIVENTGQVNKVKFGYAGKVKSIDNVWNPGAQTNNFWKGYNQVTYGGAGHLETNLTLEGNQLLTLNLGDIRFTNNGMDIDSYYCLVSKKTDEEIVMKIEALLLRDNVMTAVDKTYPDSLYQQELGDKYRVIYAKPIPFKPENKSKMIIGNYSTDVKLIPTFYTGFQTFGQCTFFAGFIARFGYGLKEEVSYSYLNSKIQYQLPVTGSVVGYDNKDEQKLLLEQGKIKSTKIKRHMLIVDEVTDNKNGTITIKGRQTNVKYDDGTVEHWELILRKVGNVFKYENSTNYKFNSGDLKNVKFKN